MTHTIDGHYEIESALLVQIQNAQELIWIDFWLRKNTIGFVSSIKQTDVGNNFNK